MRAAARALLLGSAACAAPLSQPLQQPDLPVLLRYQPPELGGPTALPEASPSGILDLSGPCIALDLGPGGRRTIVSTAESSIGRDGNGPYLQSRGQRFRHGASLKGGGGGYDRLPAFGPLQGPVPAACAAGPFLIFYDIKPFVSSSAPPRSPPPPPVTPERG